MRPGLRAFTLFTAVALLLAASSWAVTVHFAEDFTTTTYRDDANTTAHWDTSAGELGLYPFQPSLTGSIDPGGYSYGLAVEGDFAIVTNNNSDASVIDISDPASPVQVGTLNTLNFARDVAVAGNYAFVADGYSGLQVFDIQTLSGTHNAVGGYVPGGVFVTGIAVAGDHAYLAAGSAGLVVVDIGDPTAPTFAGSYDTPNDAQGVAVAGDHAYVADDASLQVLDISDPTNPTSAGYYPTAGSAGDVFVDGNLAFVADGASGLIIVDVTDPTTPLLEGSLDTSGDAQVVHVTGGFAYVADGLSGLQAVDARDPTNPVLLYGYDTPGNARAVVVAGEEAYVGDDTAGLQVIRIANVGVPFQEVGAVQVVVQGSYAQDITLSGNILYCAQGGAGLAAIDVADPLNPLVIGNFPTHGYSRGVAVSGDVAALADGDSLLVIDVSDPTNPSRLGAYDAGYAFEVSIDGDRVYYGDNQDFLTILDISDPTNPTLLDHYLAPSDVEEISVRGDLAYIAMEVDGLQILDVSDPTNPSAVGSYVPPGGRLFGLFVAGDLAFLAADDDGLLIVDVSTPASPVLVGSYFIPDATGIFVSGDVAALSNNDLVMFDISDPTDPVVLGQYLTPGSTRRAVIAGDLVYAGDSSWLRAIKIFDREVDLSLNIAQSPSIDTTTETIFRARLNSIESGAVSWELTSDGGVNWDIAQNGGDWVRLGTPGDDLRWRATLWMPPVGGSTTVSDLQIDWMDARAQIDAIVDVPDDQGGQVRLHVSRSGVDFDADPLQATAYDVYRRVDGEMVAKVAENDMVADREASRLPGVEYDTRGFVSSTSLGTFPTGTWEAVASFGALQQEDYIVVAPTLADSMAVVQFTEYVVVTRTLLPSSWYVSAPVSGYSVDNIAPGVPEGFLVAYGFVAGNQLEWDPSDATDFQYFRVYRSTDPGFTPGPGNLVHSTADLQWLDPVADPLQYHYKITALDHVGNESEPASPEEMTAVEDSPSPSRFALHANTPNPFNPSTRIRYDVPMGGGRVSIRVYDTKGRLVRTLLEEERPAGEHYVDWDGQDAEGRRLSSAVYHIRLEARGISQTRSAVLLK